MFIFWPGFDSIVWLAGVRVEHPKTVGYFSSYYRKSVVPLGLYTDFVGYLSVNISIGYSEGPQPVPTLGAAATGTSAARQGVMRSVLRRKDAVAHANKYVHSKSLCL